MEQELSKMTNSELHAEYDRCLSDHKRLMGICTRTSRRLALQALCRAEAIDDELQRRLLRSR